MLWIGLLFFLAGFEPVDMLLKTLICVTELVRVTDSICELGFSGC